ncbi:ribbon-helix-helix protein, CopG family [Spiractinospora alimapuensis]|nr:ribbon-helix-helix protein, CopG family [Spiractinospora alimapuensis]
MTLRLSDEQVEALRRVAHTEHRSMQQVARAAIEEYVSRAPVTQPRQEVPVDDVIAMFADLPVIDSDAFRADQEEFINPYVGDAYERTRDEDGDR